MEVYMRNLAFTVNKTNLKTEIAKALHHQDFLSVTVVPMNFEVHIFPRRGRARTQCGVLTLPTEAIGEQFLRIYGGQRPRKHITIGTRITFSQSNKPPRADILEEIRRVPFVDPRVEERRRDTESQLRARPVSVQCLQFGWECRDNVFSVEWEHQCPGYGRLMYSQDQREFRIKLFAENNIHIIVIQAAQVQWASAEDDESRNPVIFFSLAQPPSYETEVPPLDVLSMLERLTLENGEETRPPPASRERWSAIDTSHAEVAPYVSVAVRLVCQGASDLETFRWISSLANIGLQPFTYPVARRGLFAPAVRQEYESWLKSLPWAIAFQVESMTRDIYLDLKEMLMLRGRIENMINAQGVPHVVNFLRHFAIQLKTLFHYEDDSQGNTGSVEELFVRCEQDYVPPSRKPSLAGLAETFDCLHVTVTPTTMKLAGPFPERSNRVMRLYPQNHGSFIRVNFTDDNKLHLRFDREVDGQAFIKRRIGDMLHKGVWIAGRHFDFLAYSQSALKEHAVWFVKPFVDSKGQRVTAATIIDGLGTFDGLAHDPQLINCPARYGARISQAFTATDSSVSAEAEEVFILEDIEDTSGKWCFTDGVGTISPELIRAIWKELRARRRRTRNTPPYPRAVQIRFMGSKGMLSVDYNLSGRAICLRPSMIKFEAPNSRNIEIARAFDKPGPFYLNRPLIMILEDLGVQYKTFYDLQVTAVKEAERSTESLGQAARLLERFGLGTSFRLTSVMLSLEKLGVGPLRDDVFWKQMMDFAINHVLRGLKHHARIPVENAWNVVGVADIHKYLNEGEVFVHIAPTNGQPSRYLEGPTLVTRSPTIHPGDVQVVHAIGKPPPGSPFEKESLRNCVVFSVKGQRPLPSFLGGGDLDGDVYCCTTLESLLPPDTYTPAEYTPARRHLLDHPSTMRDVADFVTEYINSDSLGIIARNWLIIADQSDQGIFDVDCLKLSNLHSDAVDYAKSGVPVQLSSIPRLKHGSKPDWNAPETIPSGNPKFYPSKRAIGRLFREITLPALSTVQRALRSQTRTLEQGRQVTLANIVTAFRANYEPDEDDPVQVAVQDRITAFIAVGAHDEDLIVEIWEVFENYVTELQMVCTDNYISTSRNGMLTEEEAVVGTIVAKSSQPRMRREAMAKLREQTSVLVQSVAHQLAGEDGTLFEKSMERAWVAYRIACLEQGYFGAKSFAWIALTEIFDAIRNIEESEGAYT